MAKSKKPRIMSQGQVRQFIKENEIQSVEDIQTVLKDMFAETLQGMLEAEMDTHLGYQKHEDDKKDTPTGVTVTVLKRFVAITGR